jgi:hypothetical protein
VKKFATTVTAATAIVAGSLAIAAPAAAWPAPSTGPDLSSGGTEAIVVLEGTADPTRTDLPVVKLDPLGTGLVQTQWRDIVCRWLFC